MSLRIAKNDVAAWLGQAKPRASAKYKNIADEVDGQKFDSRAEARRWKELTMLARSNAISDLKRQVRFALIPKQEKPSGGVERAVTYVADFTYKRTGRLVVEDVKGVVTDVWVIKRKLMLQVHGIEVFEVKA